MPKLNFVPQVNVPVACGMEEPSGNEVNDAPVA